ncbi:MAG: hypothetical protein MJ117_09435 [Lachnospiraceae bacterium]|nr:hypothetical protein [Lachnospiraceae bacterium]
MKKTFAVAAMVLGLAGVMTTGCGFSAHMTKTTSTTTTNADGTSTTTTTTTTSEKSGSGRSSHTETTETTTKDADGNLTSYRKTSGDDGTVISYDDVSLNIINNMDFDVAQLYITTPDSDDWGENVLDGFDLPVDFETGSMDFSFDSDHAVITIGAADEDGEGVTFDRVNLKAAEDPTDISINLVYDSFTDTYTAEVH